MTNTSYSVREAKVSSSRRVVEKAIDLAKSDRKKRWGELLEQSRSNQAVPRSGIPGNRDASCGNQETNSDEK